MPRLAPSAASNAGSGFKIAGEGAGHIQSVILAGTLMTAGFILAVTGILADLISTNRKLLEEIDSILKCNLPEPAVRVSRERIRVEEEQ